MNDIKLGATVKDVLTGYVGIAYALSELLNGARQYWVLPPVLATNADKYPEGISLDENTLDVLDESLVERAVAVPPTTPRFELGQRLYDPITEFSGVAIRRMTYMNGCVYYTVEAPNHSGTRKTPELSLHASAQRWQTRESASKEPAGGLRETQPVPATARTGGPITRAQQMR